MTAAPLIQEAVGYMERHKAAQGVLVLLRDGGVSGNMVVRKVRNMDPASLGAKKSARALLLKEVEQKGKALIVLDAAKDPRLDDCEREFASAICAPICDQDHRVLGLLYADNSTTVGAFSYSDLSKAERFGEDLGTRLLETDWNRAPRPKAEPIVAETPTVSLMTWLKVGGVVAGMIMMAVMVGVLANSKAAPLQPTPTSQASAAQVAGPVGSARSFLNLLAMRQYDSAYELLSSRLKGKLKRSDFKVRVARWMDSGDNAWGLRYRDVVATGRAGHSSTVSINPTGPAASQGRWTWRLTDDKGSWKLDSLNGGPPLGARH